MDKISFYRILLWVICYFNTWIKEGFTELIMVKIACPKCNSKKLYKMQSGKRRCALYKYEFIPHKLPLTFSREQWKKILHLFLMETMRNRPAIPVRDRAAGYRTDFEGFDRYGEDRTPILDPFWTLPGANKCSKVVHRCTTISCI